MRSRRLRKTRLLILAGLVAGAVLTIHSSRAHNEAAPRGGPVTWRGLVGDAHPAVSLGQRMIVVLRTPSLAQRLAGGKLATEQQERQWTAQAYAAQQQVLTQLARHGLGVRPDYSYARVLDGFAAALDPRAVALLQRNPEVTGVYPDRAAFPAAISSAPLASGEAGTSPGVALPGFDGNGVSIALLDTGVDRSQPYLGGRVEPGIDIVGGGQAADARSDPQAPRQRERHGTELAGLLVGSGGPNGIQGAAPGATVIPIRIAGWQSNGQGRDVVYARSDQLIAGLDRAVDPNGDGDTHDAARVALIGVAEPFASFPDSPEAQAVSGALALDTLVVTPAGNDGIAGPWFGSIAGPGGSAAALTVGATDSRPVTSSVRVVLQRGLDVLASGSMSLLGAVAPTRSLVLRLALPGSGASLKGRVALALAGPDPTATAVAAERAGAAAVLLYGQPVPAGSLGPVGVPVVGINADSGRAARTLVREHIVVGVAIGRANSVSNGALGHIAPFSSRGLSFDGLVEPALSAPGIGIATSDPGSAGDGEPAFATVNGTSVAAAGVAGAAALLAQERPDLTAPDLASLLAGMARPFGEPLSTGGTGVVDVGASAVGEVASAETSLAFGNWSGRGWHATRPLTLLNVSSRPLVLDLASGSRVVTMGRARLVLRPGQDKTVKVTARTTTRLRGTAVTGALSIRPVGGRALRIPWSIGFSRPAGSLIGAVDFDRPTFAPSDTRPAVLQVQIGQIVSLPRLQIEPVRRLDLLLYTSSGAFVGVLSRLHDLLPGSYSFGITGRGPDGRPLSAGGYEVRLVAWPAIGSRPSRARVGFRIS